MIALFTLLLSLSPGHEPTCDVDGASTPAQVADTRARVARTCAAVGADPLVCELLDVMVDRESSGNTCAVHTMGQDEYGLGPLGLSVRWHLGKWDEHADESVLYSPEVSTLITLRIFRRAIQRHGADTFLGLNSVFGAGQLIPRPERDRLFCARLANNGLTCAHPVTLAHLGTDPGDQQVTFVEGLAGAPLLPLATPRRAPIAPPALPTVAPVASPPSDAGVEATPAAMIPVAITKGADAKLRAAAAQLRAEARALRERAAKIERKATAIEALVAPAAGPRAGVGSGPVSLALRAP